ncbi:MAG: hypothetical protein ABIR53_02625 [Paraperlucidibaca sp.]
MLNLDFPVISQLLQQAELQMGSVSLALVAASGLLMTGLLTGLWKYLAIATSPHARAPHYVDIAHRSSLMYSYSALLVAFMAALSPFSPTITWWATAGPLFFFASAVVTYLIHGWLNDTRNQLAKPYVLGKRHLSGVLIHGFMGMLAVVEIAGVAVLAVGVFKTLWPLL